jgi:hypothetical protein
MITQTVLGFYNKFVFGLYILMKFAEYLGTQYWTPGLCGTLKKLAI